MISTHKSPKLLKRPEEEDSSTKTVWYRSWRRKRGREIFYVHFGCGRITLIIYVRVI